MKDYIGIKGCSLPASDSGLYINSLPGMELAKIDAIATADQQNFLGVWADVQEAAILRFREDVLGMISGFDKRYRLRQVPQQVNLGLIADTTFITPAAAKRRGHTIELNGLGDQCVCSNLQSIYVQSTSFYAVAAGTVTLTYWDLDTNTQLVTASLTPTGAGWVTYKADQRFSVSRLGITIDATAVNTARIDLTGYGLGSVYQSSSDFCGCDWGTTNNYLWFDQGCTCVAMVQGYEMDLGSGKESYQSNTFGVSSVFSVVCSYDNVVCNNKRSFASAFRWLLGAELMNYQIYSSRQNRWTTVDLKRAVELRTEYEIEYRGGEKKGGLLIEGSLKQAVAGFDLNPADCCIQMDAAIRYAESLP